MRRAIEGTYTYLEFAACALAWLPLLAGSSFVHRNDVVPRHPGRWMRRFGRTTATLTPLWDFSVQGTPPADIDTRAYVVVANHLSTADPFLLSSLPWDMQWVAKEELFKLPFLGLLLKLGGDIPLKRGDGESVRAMLAACRHAIQNGLSVMLFPEGTRGNREGVAPFKDGAFEIAVEEGAPILPVAISGTQRCMPKGSRWFGRAKAVARVLEPIETKDLARLGPEGVARARDLARERIVAAVSDLEATLKPLDAE